VCRWVGYLGDPIRPEQILYESPHSLIEQSRHAVKGLVTEEGTVPAPFTNGDGFGLGWYGHREQPGLYRNVMPAWGDPNLRDIAGQIESRLFLAHVRAATGTAVQQTNSHPSRFGRWLFVPNGFVGYEHLRHDLMLAVGPRLFENVQGTTDSELLFHLALKFGLERDVVGAFERMAAFVEELGRSRGVDEPLQMTVGVSDGERLYVSGTRADQPSIRSMSRATPATSVRSAPWRARAATERRRARHRLGAARRSAGTVDRSPARDCGHPRAGRQQAHPLHPAIDHLNALAPRGRGQAARRASS
jgi:predicted glutamine amidotransferase